MTAAWGALLRLARRDIRHNLGRSLLVVLLIALPVAGVVAATSWYTTARITPSEQAAKTLGAAELALYPTDTTATPSQPQAVLPDGARTAPMWRGQLILQTAGSGSASRPVEALGVDLDGLAQGMFELVEGRAPQTADEIALTTALADQLSVTAGARLTTDMGTVDVVGLVRDPTALDRQTAVVAPDHPPAPSGFLVGLPDDADATTVARAAERGGWDVTTRSEVARSDPEQLLLIMLLGGFGFLVASLVTAAAFAVSAQRRQHELALLAASGADARHLRRSVLSSALVLGTTASIAGVAVGVAAVAATLPWLEGWTNRAIDGLTVSAPVLLGAAAVGVVTSMISSWVTARSAGRTPVAAALTGRRPPATSSARLLIAGAASTILGIVLTVTITSAAGSGTSEILTALGLLVGAGLSMVGLGAMSPWMVDQVASRFGTRFPVGIRLAMRDTARFRSRTGPIVMAIVAGLGLSVAVGATLDTIETGLAASYRPQLADDQLLVDGPAPVPLVNELRDTLPVTAAAPLTIVQPVDPTLARPLPQVVTIGDVRLLEALDAPPGAIEALTSGQVLALHEPDASDTGPPVQQAQLIAPDGVYPVALDLLPQAVPPIVLSPQTLAATGTQTGRGGTRWLLRLPQPVTDTQLEQAQQLAASFGQRITAEDGPPQIATGAIKTAATVGAGALSLLIVGVGLLLIGAETKRDDAVLAAVGASPHHRRTLAAARAATLTLLGAILAIPAGLLPIWGLATATDTGAAAGRLTLPFGTIAMTLIAVPTIAAIAAWLLTAPGPTRLTPRMR